MRDLFFLSIFVWLLAMATAVILRKPQQRATTWAGVGLGSALQIALGVESLVQSGTHLLMRMPGVPPFGDWPFRIDPLAGLLFLLLGCVGVAAALYAMGVAPRRGIGTGHGLAVIAAVQGIFTSFLLTAGNAMPFLIAWEAMSLCAYGYVLANHRRRRARHAAFVTAVVSELGFLVLVFAFIAAAAPSGSLTFSAIATAMAHRPDWMSGLLYAAVLLGFGVKSGVLPVQVWMPEAYDVTPPHLNAVLAGGLLNLGLFAILRVVSFTLHIPVAWGVVTVLIGALAVFFGALYAAMESKVRVLLAYSSIENVGFMLISLGLVIAFRATGAVHFAGVAMMALFVQMVSHGLAKALSFLAAGELRRRAGTTFLDDLGGLARRLPGLATAFVVGCLTLSAVAPFSGFSAEWMTFQTMLQVYRSLTGFEQVLVVLAGACTAVGAALGLTAFLRLFTFVFTGRSRADASPPAALRMSRLLLRPTPALVALGLGFLAVLSTVYGFFPTAVFPWFNSVVQSIVPTAGLATSVAPNVFTDPAGNTLLDSLGGRLFAFLPMPGAVIQPGAGGTASIAPTYIFWWFLVFAALAWLLARLGRGPYRRRLVPAWQGGTPARVDGQYTATAWSNPYRMFWTGLLRVRVQRPITAGSGRVPLAMALRIDSKKWLTINIYRATLRTARRGLAHIRHIQHGYLWGYLLVMLLAILGLLLWAFLR